MWRSTWFKKFFAGTLVYISSHQSAIKAAASCYIELAYKESDNNVKLIVLDQIKDLFEKHGMMDDSIMDILRIVSSPDLQVRKKCLEISMAFTSSRNVAEVVEFLKKELMKEDFCIIIVTLWYTYRFQILLTIVMLIAYHPNNRILFLCKLIDCQFYSRFT